MVRMELVKIILLVSLMLVKVTSAGESDASTLTSGYITNIVLKQDIKLESCSTQFAKCTTKVANQNRILAEQNTRICRLETAIGSKGSKTSTPESTLPNPTLLTVRTADEFQHTPLLKYGVDIRGTTSLTFKVTACNDAILAFSETEAFPKNMAEKDKFKYCELVIGGWGNTKSVFRRLQKEVTATKGARLFCKKQKMFKIDWSDNIFRVTDVGNNNKVIMKYTPLNFKINYVAITTGFKATGIWQFDTKRNGVVVDTQSTEYRYVPLLNLGVDIRGRTSLKFDVTTCNDAHFGFSKRLDGFPKSSQKTESQKKNLDVYELVLGGWSNTKSALRHFSTNKEIFFNEGPIVDCNKPKTFELDWSGNKLKISVSGKLIYEYSPLNFQMNYMAVTTGFKASGVWYFEPEVPTTLTVGTSQRIQYLPLFDYGVDIGGTTSITFKVTSCNDVIILFAPTNFFPINRDDRKNFELYEIVLGGWGNSKSVIYKFPEFKESAILKRAVLDCKQQKMFKIDWSDNKLTVMDVESGKVLVEYKPLDMDMFKFMAITGDYTARGVWEFNSKRNGIVIETYLDYKYISLFDYGIDIRGTTSLNIDVMACNDAYIGFSSMKDQFPLNQEDRTKKNFYEIMLGGWGNTRCVMRKYPSLTNIATFAGSVLDCKRRRTFQIDWSLNKLTVRDIDAGKVLLQHSPITPNNMNYVAISTRWKTHGTWFFWISNNGKNYARKTDRAARLLKIKKAIEYYSCIYICLNCDSPKTLFMLTKCLKNHCHEYLASFTAMSNYPLKVVKFTPSKGQVCHVPLCDLN